MSDVTSEAGPLRFDQHGLHSRIDALTDAQLDELGFGVIGFDAVGLVCRYNAAESHSAGLSPQRVLGRPLFTVVAPCMNNFMVAQRFDDASGVGAVLDTRVDYVLTLRMRPAKVTLRLLAAPRLPRRYVLVHWIAG